MFKYVVGVHILSAQHTFKSDQKTNLLNLLSFSVNFEGTRIPNLLFIIRYCAQESSVIIKPPTTLLTEVQTFQKTKHIRI